MIASLLIFAVDAEDAADNVRPGWIPLLIVLALGAFVAFLFFSLRKQLNKIDIPEGGVPTKGEKTTPDETGPPTA